MSLDIFARLLPHKSFDTAFGKCDVIQSLDDMGRTVRLMRIGESLQSATYLGKRWNVPPFEYIKAFDHMFEALDPINVKSVLMIGGGGFSYPKHLLTQYDDVSMDVVEIDPAVIEIARRFFFLDRLEKTLASNGREDRLHIIAQDGLEFLEMTDKVYDVIINDSFEGEIATSDLICLDGIDSVVSHLRRGGLYMTNIVVDFTREGASGLHRFMTSLNARFDNVYVCDASDPSFGGADNYIVIATDGAYEFTNLIPWDL